MKQLGISGIFCTAFISRLSAKSMYMKSMIFRFVLLPGVILFFVLPTSPSQATAMRSTLVQRHVAVISNSGSINTIGYRIYVVPTGEVWYVDGKGSGQSTLSVKLTKKFFHDIKLAEPLSKLPVKQPCIKSVSFGTTTQISLGGEQSSDISCPGNKKALYLKDDVYALVKILHIINVPNHCGKPLPPINF